MSDIIRILDQKRADNRFQDGGLPHAAGVQSFQIMRANRRHPEWADGFGWTYNHAAMLAWAYGRFFCEYLSNPVDEHQVPGHTLLVSSTDGRHWGKPVLAFPEIEIPTAQYKGPRSPLLKATVLTVPHQRMGFYLAKNGVLVALSFYGIVHDRKVSAPCDGWGVGRAVRRILPDGSLDASIYFLIYNEPAGYTAENTPVFSPYWHSGDAELIAACDELLKNGPAMRQMYEEQRFDKRLFPTPGAEALSYYTVSDQEIVGVYKKSLVSLSHDQGQTWSPPEFQPTIHTASGKVWGQRTSDGRFALLYNPTPDGQHRWPIAAVTGDNGHDFDHMVGITGDMSPQRYGGLDKNLGPQYMRGIAQCNAQAPDGDIWLVYSNNKEDIWISRVPVPLTAVGPAQGELTVAEGRLPEDWSVYAPVWSPVEPEGGALVLRDKDPCDMAWVERAIQPCRRGEITLTLQIDHLAKSGGVTLEIQDNAGQTAIRLVFRPDGRLYARGDGRTEPWQPYQPGRPYELTIRFDGTRGRWQATMAGAEKELSYNASVNTLTRFRLSTKEKIPHLSTLEDVGKYGVKEQVLPGSDEPTGETCVRLITASWRVEG